MLYITDIYDIKRTRTRGKAKEGLIRPTISQFFTSKDFHEVTTYVPPVSIGDAYAGGIVGYILQVGDYDYIDDDKQRGYIVTTETLSTKYSWGTNQAVTGWGTGVYGLNIENTYQNTIDIANHFNSSSCAAQVCLDLIDGGFDDWMLPSLNLLKKFYPVRHTIGDFTGWAYVCSSQNNTYNTYHQLYTDGDNGYVHTSMGKDSVQSVRPVRFFIK